MIFSRAAANCLAHSISDMLASDLNKAAPHKPLGYLHHISPEDSLVRQDFYLYIYIYLFYSSTHCSLLLLRMALIESGLLVMDWHSLYVKLLYASLIGSTGWDMGQLRQFFFKVWKWVLGWYFSQGPGSHVSGNLSEQITYYVDVNGMNLHVFWQIRICKHVVLIISLNFSFVIKHVSNKTFGMFSSKWKYRKERKHTISIQITLVSCQLSNI